MDKNKIILMLSILVIINIGCSWVSPSKNNLYYKRIILRNGEIRWYFLSLIGNFTPDYLVIKYEDSTLDTICCASNIVDMYVKGFDTINVIFRSSPKIYDENIKIRTRFKEFYVKVDTNGTTVMDSIKSENSF